jgi:hypothetical protein
VLLQLTAKGEALVGELAARHLAELLRHEPLIRSSLDQLKALAPASGVATRGGNGAVDKPKKKRAATRRGPRAP